MTNFVINRKALMSRHNPFYTKPEINAPLSLGNGNFCYTVDFTGLQTFNERYSRFPLCTMSNWGWHCYPDSGQDPGLFRLTSFDTYGREVGYAVDEKGQEELYNSLRQNPHRFNLASLGLDIPKDAIDDCSNFCQNLNLWEACIDSSFNLWGETVSVHNFVRSDEDTICIRLTSKLLETGKLRIRLTFPYGSHLKNGSDYTKPQCHQSLPEKLSSSLLNIHRRLDTTSYTVQVLMDGETSYNFSEDHLFIFETKKDTLSFALRFVREGDTLPSGGSVVSVEKYIDEGKEKTRAFWEKYWMDGGAIDLSDSSSPKATELERRIVLSQYLVAIQNRGDLPPAETGLTCNSWYGKFHLEMHYWHSAHFPLWNRVGELEKSFAWYKRILKTAQGYASAQGYTGARWPKMCGPDGDNSPSPIAVLLIWQQPHPILFGELIYKQNQSRAFLEEYKEVIRESAEFMLKFMYRDSSRYILGPPLIPAQERFKAQTVLNPGYEVEYFRWALRKAAVLLKILGEERPDFIDAANKLVAPVVYQGVFPAHENCPNTFTEKPFNTDHPSMLGMMGLLPGDGIDKKTMNDTLNRVLSDWDLPSCWGWDFPMMAMTAARLGRRKDAVDLLLMENPKNSYLPNGHNPQAARDDLPLYLPGNGGLLLATAMMAAGWDDDDGSFAPGFPNDGSFKVRAEKLYKYI